MVDVAQKIGDHLLKGYTMLASSCNKCNLAPLMRNRMGAELCVVCEGETSLSAVVVNSPKSSNEFIAVVSPETGQTDEKPEEDQFEDRSATCLGGKCPPKGCLQNMRTPSIGPTESLSEKLEKEWILPLRSFLEVMRRKIGRDITHLALEDVLNDCRVISLMFDSFDLMLNTLQTGKLEFRNVDMYKYLPLYLGGLQQRMDHIWSFNTDGDGCVAITRLQYKAVKKICKLFERLRKY